MGFGGDGRNTGIKTGLNKGQFQQALFDDQYKNKLTDPEISKALEKEFPESGEGLSLRYICIIRNRYNRGEIPGGSHMPPEVPVPRFGQDRKPLLINRGKSPRQPWEKIERRK